MLSVVRKAVSEISVAIAAERRDIKGGIVKKVFQLASEAWAIFCAIRGGHNSRCLRIGLQLRRQQFVRGSIGNSVNGFCSSPAGSCCSGCPRPDRGSGTGVSLSWLPVDRTEPPHTRFG